MSQSKLNISLDIETTGVSPGCGIWQIGACVVENPDLTFKSTINPANVLEAWESDPRTIHWQETVNKENWIKAQTEFNHNALVWALSDFMFWLQGFGKADDLYIWTKGPHFDIAILDEAYRRYDRASPWTYYNIRDVRTLQHLVPNVNVLKPDGLHDALVDAQYQAKIIKAALEVICYYQQVEIDRDRYGE